jgi:hypothetical protein
MKNTALLLIALIATALPAAPLDLSRAPGSEAETAGRDWIARSSDNICGLRDTKQVSHPATVSWSTLWRATPEIQRIEREGIDENSVEGIKLRQDAVDRINRACKQVMSERGLCSVWKRIRHRDGRTVPDVTDQVRASL